MPDSPNWHSWTYRLTQSGGGVAISHDALGQREFRKRMAKRPSTRLISALDAYQRAFFPSMRVDDLPWRRHNQLARKDGNARRERAEEQWRLAWYWKALYLLIPQWKKADAGRWFIRICQVRDWALAYYYKQVGNENKLLQAPIFGQSDRLLRFDSYYVLLSFEREVLEAWNRALDVSKERRADEAHAEKAFVLGRTDFVYRLDDIVREKNGTLRISVSAYLELYPFRVPTDDGRRRLPNIRGLRSKELPATITYPYEMVWVPSWGNGGTESGEKPFLLASLPVCRAFEKLSEVWNDRTARSVLIIAPPGAGKELLAGSIYDLREFEGGYCAFALSPTDHEGNAAMLYARSLLGSRPIRKELEAMSSGTLKPNARLVRDPEDGLVFKARRGVLFLDEIDKVSMATRAALLRLLETEECAVHGTAITVSLKHVSPVYVFAGSAGRDEMFRLKPADFWTRISHVIEMEHPLAVDSPWDRERIARSYFHMFWIQHVFASCEKTHLISRTNKRRRAHPAHDVSRTEVVGLIRFLLDKRVTQFFARMFAEEVCAGREKVEFSIRNVRNTVARVLYSLLDYLLVDRTYDSSFGRLQDALLSGRTGTHDASLFEFLSRALADEAVGEAIDEPAIEAELQTELRRIVQASISKVLA
jgi:hypothetical protein